MKGLSPGGTVLRRDCPFPRSGDYVSLRAGVASV
jgi:hypothetical protein